MRRAWLLVGTLGLGLGLGCGTSSTAAVDTAPTPLVAASCEVCGMMVSEQPSPRAQLVYRDGTHAHFCSMGELRATVQARSPHGEPVALYVEALPADFDPAANQTAPLPWVPAESAHYLTGADRPLVMGVPVLSFADAESAELLAARPGLSETTWTALRDTPFNLSP